MKLNINKLLTGGGIVFSSVANPFSNSALTSLQQTSSTSLSTEDTILPKGLLKELMLKALPNDYRLFEAMLAEILDVPSFNSASTRLKIHQLRNYAVLMLNSKERYQEATKAAYQNGSWDEYAVDSYGKLYIYEDNKIKTIAPSEFKKDKMVPLTIGELSRLRAESGDLINRNDIISSIGNNIGMEKISEFIQKIIHEVGSSETSSEAYVSLAALVGRDAAKRPSDNQMQSIALTNNALTKLGPDAIFKLKLEGNAELLNAAFNYIFLVLPNNMKNLLMANWVANGGDYKRQGEVVSNIITNALTMKHTSKEQLNFELNINKSAGVGSASDTRKLSYIEEFFKQDFNRTSINISDPGYKNLYSMIVLGTVIPSLITDNGNGTGAGPLDKVLSASGNGMLKYLDQNKIWFGTDKKISAYLSKVFYNEAQVANVYLPITPTGDIDWASFANFEEAEEEIERLNITDYNLKNSIHRKHGSRAQYGPDGRIIPDSGVGNFLMTHGYTFDNVLSATNTLCKEIEGDNEDAIDAMINESLSKFKTSIPGKHFYNDIMEIPIFIKIQPNALTNARYFSNNGDLVQKTSLDEASALALINSPATTTINGSGNQLYEE